MPVQTLKTKPKIEAEIKKKIKAKRKNIGWQDNKKPHLILIEKPLPSGPSGQFSLPEMRLYSIAGIDDFPHEGISIAIHPISPLWRLFYIRPFRYNRRKNITSILKPTVSGKIATPRHNWAKPERYIKIKISDRDIKSLCWMKLEKYNTRYSCFFRIGKFIISEIKNYNLNKVFFKTAILNFLKWIKNSKKRFDFQRKKPLLTDGYFLFFAVFAQKTPRFLSFLALLLAELKPLNCKKAEIEQSNPIFRIISYCFYYCFYCFAD